MGNHLLLAAAPAPVRMASTADTRNIDGSTAKEKKKGSDDETER
jgi:hypothetical protein